MAPRIRPSAVRRGGPDVCRARGDPPRTRPRGAARRTVTVLPPGVVHDGRPAPCAAGFRKRE